MRLNGVRPARSQRERLRKIYELCKARSAGTASTRQRGAVFVETIA